MSHEEGGPDFKELFKRSLTKVAELKARLETITEAAAEPIAIVGLACRFPAGSVDPESYWQALLQGRDGVAAIPSQRWPQSALPADNPATRWAGLLDSVDRFDATFFGISPREAASLDPQQRLLLELTWESLESAGIVPSSLLSSATGVFIGLSSTDYRQLVAHKSAESVDAFDTTGNLASTAAGRISYTLGLQGPCLTLDTACSSALVAVHTACASLRSRECDLAVAGGVNVILDPGSMLLLSRTQALSPDGRCKTFDAAANGFVRAEGGGVVVLKRLSEALAARDSIAAVIRGSAVNQDGRSTGLTTPNVLAQQAMLRRALEQAKLSPADIGLIETHGTGTSLGDPIEVEAIKAVLGNPRADGSVCYLGAVKTNLGHLEAAAGIAGLIKAVLCLQHQTIPKNLHFRTLNPRIDLVGTALSIPTQTVAWPTGTKPRRAGVSAFGLSGTNAHVVLEEAPPVALAPAAAHPSPVCLLPLSAQSAVALQAQTAQLIRHLEAHPDQSAQAVCYSAARARSHFDHRLIAIGKTREDLLAALRAFRSRQPHADWSTGTVPDSQSRRLVFVFPGQGGQWRGMGKQLLAQEPAFRQAITSCQRSMSPYFQFSLVDILQGVGSDAALEDVQIIQPALFAMQIGLWALWRSWGVEPVAVVGHSMGEIAAAHAAGWLTLDEACQIVCLRSQLVRRTSGQGAMAMLELSEDRARQAIHEFRDSVAIAAINGPRNVVISGLRSAVEEIVQRQHKAEVFCRLIKVDYASHSPQMEVLKQDLLRGLSMVNGTMGAVPIYSTVTGQRIQQPLTAAYWERNLRQPVRFWNAVQALTQDGFDTFLELSPHPVLLPAIQEGLGAGSKHLTVTATMRREEGIEGPLAALGKLYVQGIPVHWDKVWPAGGPFVQLPTYPWQRQYYWVDPSRTESVPPRAGHPLLGLPIEISTQPGMRLWETLLDPRRLSYLHSHRIQQTVVFPATGYIEMALAVAKELWGNQPYVLQELVLHAAMALTTNQPRSIQLVITPEAYEQLQFQIASRAPGEKCSWQRHASGHLRLAAKDPPPPEVLQTIRARCIDQLSGRDYYVSLTKLGMEYGPAFQGVTQLAVGPAESLAEVQLPESVDSEAADYGIHPALLDACLQGVMAAFGHPATDGPLVPTKIESVRVHRPLGRKVWSHTQLRRAASAVNNSDEADVRIFDDSGQVLAEVLGVQVQALDKTTAVERPRQLNHEWWPLPLPAAAAVSQTRHYLILTDEGGVAAALRQTLEASGATVTLRPPPRGVADLQRQLTDQPSRLPYTAMVYLANLDVTAKTSLGVLEKVVQRDCGLVVQIVQTLARAALRSPPELWLVTRGVHATGEDRTPLSPATGLLWGLGRTIVSEHTELSCTCVDLAPAPYVDELAALGQELLRGAHEQEVALRTASRFVGRLVRREGSLSQEKLSLQSDATYLITGGLGGLGLRAASWMVRRGARHLVLLGRQGAFSPEQRKAVQALQQAGAVVVVAKCDVTQHAEVAAVLDQIKNTLPPLRGVMHTAAILDDAMLLEQNPDRFARVAAPKVAGAWNLHELTLHHKLDFFVLYSSAAALLGQPGQGNYSAANAFLDALAHYRRSLGLAALSINWGLFTAVGMLKARPEQAAQLSTRGFKSLTLDQHDQALNDLLTSHATQAGIVALDPRQWVEYYPQVARSSLFHELVREARHSAAATSADRMLLQTLRSATPEQQPELMESYLRQQLAQVLRMTASQINPTTPFRSLGVDSLLGLELRNRLEAGTGLKLPATIIWTYPQVQLLAQHILIRLGLQTPDAPKSDQDPDADNRDDSLTQLSDEDLLAAAAATLTSDLEQD